MTINYLEINALNYHTEGFAVTCGPSSIFVSEGSMTIHSAYGTTLFEYPSFEFEVECDKDVSVVYDVYLLEYNNPEDARIHIDRTEMVMNTVPMYEGDIQHLHCLMSFEMTCGSDIQDVSINVRTVTLGENRSQSQVVD